MTEASRFQESSSFRMQAPDGEIVNVDVFTEFVDGANRWSERRPDWQESGRKRYLGPGGQPVVAVEDHEDEFAFAADPTRIFKRISPY